MFRQTDPFFMKKELAPSDHEAVAKRKSLVHDLLSPHGWLISFLLSHFNATRLGSADTQKVFLRFMDVTLDAIKVSTPHPLARKLRLQVILFGLRILRACTTIGTIAEWRLKDKILSAALSWFKTAPQYSFGNNVLQVKTELHLLADVLGAMKPVAGIGAKAVGNAKSLQAKEQLLTVLLQHEQSRLAVWLSPVDDGSRSQPFGNKMSKNALEVSCFPASVSVASESSDLTLASQSLLVSLVRTAWAESPTLAVELVTRFPFPRLHTEVRWLLLNVPAKAVHEPEAIPILLQERLPSDVNFLQLKVRFYYSYQVASSLGGCPVANKSSTCSTGRL